MTHDQSSHDRVLEAAARPDISSLASTVITLLSDKSDEAYRKARDSVVLKLVTECLNVRDYNAPRLVDDLLSNRLRADQIVDIYIPAAARALGEMWLADDISFAQVTIGTARLQGLLGPFGAHWDSDPDEEGARINVLMILQSGESHTLGPHVAAAQMRRLGASVRILFGGGDDRIVEVMSQETFDMIMFSCASTDALETVSQMVKRVRSFYPDGPPIALGGLVLNFAERIRERTGVDLVTSDVKVAHRLCDMNKRKSKSVST